MEGVEAESRNGVPVYPYFDAYWEDADRIPLGIWVAGELIGFCLLRDNGTAWEIAEFFITPDLRRRGVGTAAVDEIKNVCRQLGRHAELQAKVKQWNSPALAFWKNQGFQPRSQDETDITTSVSL